MVTSLVFNRFCTLYCVDLMYSSKYRHLCVLSFDITFVYIYITIAKLSAAKVRFLKKSRLSKDSYLPTIKVLCYSKFTPGYIEEVLFSGCF